MSLSESLNNFYMEVDSADALEESRNFTPNLSFNRSNRQTPYTQSQLSLHSQAASQDHEFDYDYPNDYPAASCDDEILAHGELGSIDSGLGDTNIDLADIGGLGIGDSICHSTEETEIIEGGTRLTERPKSRFPLHRRGVNINGRLPREARRYQRVMDDEPTQPQTQPYHDPRRHGYSSMLGEQDETDIIAILHPTSPSAHRAVSLTAEVASQHILQNDALSQIEEEQVIEEGNDELTQRTQASDANRSARDIALRFSSKVNDLRHGFYFGRNPTNADIILGGKPHSGISSRQFRIFLNQNGILMLEDTSTNGTMVDNVVLRGNRCVSPMGESQPRTTLHQGALIELVTSSSRSGDVIRFVVNIPSRDIGQTKYNQNLTGYLQCINQAERRAAALQKAGGNAADVIPVPTNTLPSGIRQEVSPATSTHIATTGGNTQGMHWNGGTKYNVVSYLGSGAMAVVFKLSSRRDGEVYACKQLDKKRFLRNGIVGDKVYNELNIMKKLRHPYIVQCTDQHETDTNIFIVMELVPHGDLGAYTGAGKLMPEHDTVVVARQMVDALDYLHKCGITHRDIKPENILVAAPYPWIFKLSDFGLAKLVKNDETFLKTFCGTLLYLAPEVYPGYPLVKSGKDPTAKRTRDALPVEPRPYRHSVDIWSLGAVLYQLLAAKPAWSGTSANNGAEFLVTVMTIPVDYERLIMVGNSQAAANFISRMLVLDPRGRARETELKVHPWLQSHPSTLDPNATIDASEELDASQLSLVDNSYEPEADLEYDEDLEDPVADHRDTKRSRAADWIGEEDDDLPDLYGNRLAQAIPKSYFAYDTNQSLPDISGPPPPRLFGEIGSSALQSSGVLGQNANVALEVTMEEDSDEEYATSSFQNGLVRVSEQPSAGYPNLPSTQLNTTQHSVNEGVTQHNLQYPNPLPHSTDYSAAPSLFGAEALVGQLNMASPSSGVSLESKAASPRTPTSREFSPVSTNSKRPSQAVESTQEDPTIKRSRTGRFSSSPNVERRSMGPPADHHSSVPTSSDKTAVGDTTAGKNDASAGVKNSNPTSQENKEHSQGSIDKHDSPNASVEARSRATTAGASPKNPSQDSNPNDHQDGQQSNPQAGSAASTSGKAATNPNASTTSTSTSTTTPKPPLPNRAPLTPSIDLPPPPIPSDDGFIKPNLCRFGTLFPTRGSIKTVPKIKLTTMGTTFGRSSDNKFVHPNPHELRVPKGAFDLQLWYPGMEKDLESGVDWTRDPKLSCFISTRTTRYIKVNGVRLMKGKDCWLYGKLRSGDIISVFELAEGQEAHCDADREYLRFMCEFYVGGSRAHRKAESDRFVVLKEKSKWGKVGRSREGSVVGDAGNAEAGANVSAAATMMAGGRSVAATMAPGGQGQQNTVAGQGSTTDKSATDKSSAGKESTTKSQEPSKTSAG